MAATPPPCLNCDVAIIGAGSAGLAAERSARGAGASTLLIDDRFAGTTCTTVGCMPSKLLITAANTAASARRADIFGVHVGPVAIDGAAVLRRVQSERDRFAETVRRSIADLPPGVTVRARARFTARTALALDDGRTVQAKAVVIATGARPGIPDLFADVQDRVLTNETVFELPDLPPSIAVVGAGLIGLELAQALSRLGVETAVFDKGHQLAGLRDSVVADTLRGILEKELPVRLGVTLQARPAGNGVSLSWNGGGNEPGQQCFDKMLIAAGQQPQLRELDLERTGIALDDQGVPHFDPATLQCGDAPIFIAGDANADRPVVHEASAEGAIAGRNAAGYPRVTPSRRDVPFSLMFTDPPLAIIGDAGGDMNALVGTASYEDQGRAKLEARNAGISRLYAAKADGRLIGAAMAGPGMDHTAHLIAWAIQRGETADALLKLPIYHPSFEEGLKPALHDICRQLPGAVSPGEEAAAA